MLESQMDPLPRIHGRSRDVGRLVAFVGTQHELIGAWGVVTGLQSQGVVIVDLKGVDGNSCFSVGERVETYSKEWAPTDSQL